MEVEVGHDGRMDLDNVSELGALYEGHLGLVDDKGDALFVTEAHEFLGNAVRVTYSVYTYSTGNGACTLR